MAKKQIDISKLAFKLSQDQIVALEAKRHAELESELQALREKYRGALEVVSFEEAIKLVEAFERNDMAVISQWLKENPETDYETLGKFQLAARMIGAHSQSTSTASKGGLARNEPYRLAEQRIINFWKRGVYDSIPECVREEIEALRKYQPGLEKLSVRVVEDWLRKYERTK